VKPVRRVILVRIMSRLVRRVKSVILVLHVTHVSFVTLVIGAILVKFVIRAIVVI